ncbi:MAG: AraC family transcriptional regulator [Pseudomonadota bacterium]
MQTNALTSLSHGPQTDTDWRLAPLSIADWAAVWSPIVDMHALHPRNEDGTSFWGGRVQGRLAGAKFATGSQLAQRSQRLASTPNGALAIQFLSAGSIAMDFECRSFVQRPGHITIVDLAQPFRASHQDAVGEIMFMPRELLGFSQSDRIDPVLIPIDSVQGVMLATELHHFFEPVEHVGEESDFDPNTLLHLTNSILSSHRHASSDRVEWWRARNRLIRDYIEENLGDLSLLPARICDQFNLSRATLYRMFEVDGGVRRYIQDRRLYAAVWDLAEGGIHRGRLTEVAEKWGFSSNANFNRAVKTVFGMPPGALFRGPALIIPSRIDQKQSEFPVYAWFSQLQDQNVLIY